MIYEGGANGRTERVFGECFNHLVAKEAHTGPNLMQSAFGIGSGKVTCKQADPVASQEIDRLQSDHFLQSPGDVRVRPYVDREAAIGGQEQEADA